MKGVEFWVDFPSISAKPLKTLDFIGFLAAFLFVYLTGWNNSKKIKKTPEALSAL